MRGEWNKKWRPLAGLIPALVVVLCVTSSLSGYVAPVYEIPKASASVQENTAAKEDEPEEGESSLVQSSSDVTKKAKAKKTSSKAANTTSAQNTEASTTRTSPTVVPVAENQAYKDGTYYGTGTGFSGKLQVRVVIKNGKIISIDLVSSSDDVAYMNKAKSLLTTMIVRQSTNVDTVSGATFSSSGLIEAVRNALSQAAVSTQAARTTVQPTKQASDKKEDNKNTDKKKDSKTDKKVTYKDGTYTGTAKGFRDGVKVKVTIKNNKITKIKVVSYNDDDAFFKKAMVLLDTVIAKQTTEVDTISGATKSSNGILKAIKAALNKAKKNNKSDDQKNDDKKDDDTKQNEDEKKDDIKEDPVDEEDKDTETTDSTDEKPADDKPTEEDKEDTKDESGDISPEDEPAVELIYNNGTYSGKGSCVEFGYTISLNVVIENDIIKDITDIIMNPESSTNLEYVNDAVNGYGKHTGVKKQILDTQQTEQIDAVTGATYSSKAIVTAVKKALAKAKK